MPLPKNTPRKKVHRRQITCDGYQRVDGLWDIDAHIVDTKTFPLDYYEDKAKPFFIAGSDIFGMISQVPSQTNAQ